MSTPGLESDSGSGSDGADSGGCEGEGRRWWRAKRGRGGDGDVGNDRADGEGGDGGVGAGGDVENRQRWW